MSSRARMRWSAAAASVGFVVVALLAGIIAGPPAAPSDRRFTASGGGLYFDYVIVVIMENKNLCELYTHCGGSATYMTSLGDAYSMLLDYRYCNQNPSLPNYLCLSGGTNFGCTSNTNPNSGCATAAWNAPNVVDRLEAAGLSWKAYMEDMPQNCYGDNSGSYAVRHNPFVYYRLNVETPSRCALIVPAGSNADALVNDLGSTSTAKNFMWLTPNTCNDMHDCSIATGDAYLSTLIPRILGSTIFTSQRAALFLTLDEGYGEPTYASWSGPVARPAYTSSAYYDAYSFLKTVEKNWNLDYLTDNDNNASAMDEFFRAAGPDFWVAANPTYLAFPAGNAAATTVTVRYYGGFNGTVGLTASSTPSGISTTCVPSSVPGNATSTCTMTASAQGTYSVKITGTSGTLVHSSTLKVTVTAPPVPEFTIAASPNRVTFATGGSASTTVTVQATGGFTGTVDLTANSVPSGVTTTCVPTSVAGGSGTSTCTMSGATDGKYSVTITGTSGSLVHSTAVAAEVDPPGPKARFTFHPAFPDVNQNVTFDASSSTDTDPGATLEARWDWDGDGGWDTPYSMTLTAQCVFSDAGTHLVRLEIRDSHGLVNQAARPVLVPSGDDEVGAPPGYGLTNPTLETRGPIYIGDNSGFTFANGVRSGTGTAADPYVISNWFIDGSLYTGSQAMIQIETTDAYVIIENNRIANLADLNHWEGIQLGHWPAILNTSHVTIQHNELLNVRHAYGIAVREGSRDVYVGANYIAMDANSNDVYGIATDRNVHDVTIYGNYVNAFTSGTFRTAGIHIGDTHIDDARRATNVVARRNTVANATEGGIVSLSSTGTRIEANRVSTDYPAPKSVGPDYPRGIITEQNSIGTLVVGNRIQAVHWGIEVGADRGTFVSNLLANVDYAIYVVDNGTFPGATSYGETIYDTTYFGVSAQGIRLPAGFRGTVVDLGSDVRPSDMTAGTLSVAGTMTRISYSWSGYNLNLSVTVDGAVVYDTLVPSTGQNLLATWSGTIMSLDVMSLETTRVAFQLQASGSVSFSGSGFVPSETYTLNRTDGVGTTTVLSTSASPTGGLVFTIPANAGSSAFGLEAESAGGDPLAPTSTASVVGTSGTNGWYVSAVNVTLTATSPSGATVSIAYRLDGRTWSTYLGPIAVGEGDHVLQWQASDDAGHRGSIRSWPIRIDLTDPTVTGLSPSGRVGDSHAAVSWTGSDDLSGIARFEVSIDGGPFRSVGTNTSYSESWPAGPHTVHVKAVDNAGHETVAATSFTIDVSVVLPSMLEIVPLSFPGVALVLLAMSFVLLRRYHNKARIPSPLGGPRLPRTPDSRDETPAAGPSEPPAPPESDELSPEDVSNGGRKESDPEPVEPSGDASSPEEVGPGGHPESDPDQVRPSDDGSIPEAAQKDDQKESTSPEEASSRGDASETRQSASPTPDGGDSSTEHGS